MKKTVEFIKALSSISPEIGIVLGSGLGNFADQLEGVTSIAYSDIPGFPVSTVEGHSGELIFGKIMGKDVVCMKGRIHYYEGFSMDEVTFPIKVMCELGIKSLIITNAAGGVNEDFHPGDLMLITDHINFAGINPLIGPNKEEDGPRFPDLSFAYNRDLLDMARSKANELNINVREGVYMYFTGPSYETPAEIRMARTMGADAVGMSTVPESIVANHRGVSVLGISCITNMAAGILPQALDHKEVMEISRMVREKFNLLLTNCIGGM